MTTTAPRKPGDRVRVDSPKYPGIWVIDRTGPVNAVLRPEGGVGRLLRAPYSLLLDPDAPTVTVEDVPSIFSVGEIVRIDGKYAGTYVVIKDSGTDKVNLAKLGGDGGRYVRALRRGIVKVDPSEVLK